VRQLTDVNKIEVPLIRGDEEEAVPAVVGTSVALEQYRPNNKMEEMPKAHTKMDKHNGEDEQAQDLAAEGTTGDYYAGCFNGSGNTFENGTPMATNKRYN